MAEAGVWHGALSGMVEAGVWHGGDLGEARRLFPAAPEPWIDLSTGINPVPYPVPELTPDLFRRLPAPGDLADLERAAAEAYGAQDPALVVAAPGTQVLIGLLPRLREPGPVAVLGPTYAEHARAWRAAGHRVSDIAALPDPERVEALVVVNPNNPDGRVLGRSSLLGMAEAMERRGGLLVVDEAFADFDADESLVPGLPGNVVVLRSFGKTYGLAGLRLGFAIAGPPLAQRLREALGPWAVSGPALAVGRLALRDHAWFASAAGARRADSRQLAELLARVTGAQAYGTSLYRTIETPRAPALFAALGRRGVWIRRFQDNPHRLRIGLPAGEEAWRRLEAGLGAGMRANEALPSVPG